MYTLRILCVGSLALCCCASPVEADPKLVGQTIKSGEIFAEVPEVNTTDPRLASKYWFCTIEDDCNKLFMDFTEDSLSCECKKSAWKLTLWVIGILLAIPLVFIALKWWCTSSDGTCGKD